MPAEQVLEQKERITERNGTAAGQPPLVDGDVDAAETRELLDALEGVLKHEGSDRARFLLTQLKNWSKAVSPQSDSGRPQPLMLHQRPETASDFVAPSGEVEQRVAEIWQALLGIKRVGRADGDNLLSRGSGIA